MAPRPNRPRPLGTKDPCLPPLRPPLCHGGTPVGTPSFSDGTASEGAGGIFDSPITPSDTSVEPVGAVGAGSDVSVVFGSTQV
mmetsp:Transcript_15432/g.23287  ORF Transcript_15432/g.23287 Transcript_15432/m.23287 type:complete len:83 (+) Transcript_15432:207-455(+)